MNKSSSSANYNQKIEIVSSAIAEIVNDLSEKHSARFMIVNFERKNFYYNDLAKKMLGKIHYPIEVIEMKGSLNKIAEKQTSKYLNFVFLCSSDPNCNFKPKKRGQEKYGFHHGDGFFSTEKKKFVLSYHNSMENLNESLNDGHYRFKLFHSKWNNSLVLVNRRRFLSKTNPCINVTEIVNIFPSEIMKWKHSKFLENYEVRDFENCYSNVSTLR